MNIVYKNIIEQSRKLNPYELEQLIRELSNDKIENTVESIYLEVDELNQRVCQKCGSIHIRKHGKVNGNQRYACQDCHKTFFHTNGTPFYKTHKSKLQWIMFIEDMLKGASLRNSSESIGINLKTALKWRHKIMAALKSKLENNVLEGNIELDDTFFRRSRKGLKVSIEKLPTKRGISNNLICYTTAVAQNGAVVSTFNEYGKNTIEKMMDKFSNKIKTGSTVYSDEEKAYAEFCKRNNLKEVSYNSKVVKEKHLLKNISSLHSMLKDKMRDCRGVSNKHLDKYIQWVSWMKESSKISFSQKINAMFNDCCRV